MPITVTKNFRLADVELTDRALMREIGLLARERIVRRTRQGVDAEGRPFQPYSPGYASAKRRDLGGSGTVNLTVSGAMLNSLQVVEVTDDSVTLGFG